jgi:hypothetical protein
MITKIKEIHWWDPKLQQDAVTWKVWVEHDDKTELVYFTSQAELDAFVLQDEKSKKTTGKKKNIK